MKSGIAIPAKRRTNTKCYANVWVIINTEHGKGAMPLGLGETAIAINGKTAENLLGGRDTTIVNVKKLIQRHRLFFEAFKLSNKDIMRGCSFLFRINTEGNRYSKTTITQR